MVEIGAKTVMGQECTISAYQRVRIGEQCVIADRAMFIDFDHGVVEVERPIREQGIYMRDVEVGSNVWIGYGACILRGVRVGDNSIVGTNSVVTKDVPANAVVAGIPARVIRMREAPQELRWPDPVEPDPAPRRPCRHPPEDEVHVWPLWGAQREPGRRSTSSRVRRLRHRSAERCRQRVQPVLAGGEVEAPVPGGEGEILRRQSKRRRQVQGVEAAQTGRTRQPRPRVGRGTRRSRRRRRRASRLRISRHLRGRRHG